MNREISTQNKQTRDENNPARGFPIKKPKPDNTDNRVREVEVANRVGPIVRMIRAIVTPPDTDTGSSHPTTCYRCDPYPARALSSGFARSPVPDA